MIGLGFLTCLAAVYAFSLYNGAGLPSGSLDAWGKTGGPSKVLLMGMLVLLVSSAGTGWLVSVLLKKRFRRRVELIQHCLQAVNPSGKPGQRISLPDREDPFFELSDTVNRCLGNMEKNASILKTLEEDFTRLFTQGVSGNFWVSPAGEILRCNQRFAQLLGYETMREVAGVSLPTLLPEGGEWEKLVREVQARKKIEKTEWPVYDRYKNPRVVQGRLFGKTDEEGRIVQIQGTWIDQSEMIRLKAGLDQSRYRDPLTGLLSRSSFEKEMERFDQGDYDPLGILTVDVNGLKFVNDTVSYEEGDRLLAKAAEILQEAFPGNVTIGRVGGDELAVLVVRTEREVLAEARRNIRRAVKAYNDTLPDLPLSLAVGFALNDEAPATVREVFTQADNNMYREKLLCNQSIHSSVVQTLNKALEARDFITEGHARRIQDLVESLAEAIGLPERSVIDLRLLAQFHDIGKVGIPDRILMKAGPLNPEEAIEMQRHCEIGYRIALAATDLVPIADWILKHHEWWNGHGYPAGLIGERIPLECRILAIADAFDVLTNDRPYRRAVSQEEAIEEISRYSGIQFDPLLVKKFCELLTDGGPTGTMKTAA
jgi:diguanylate cyclase (GGDEF)-like protein